MPKLALLLILILALGCGVQGHTVVDWVRDQGGAINSIDVGVSFEAISPHVTFMRDGLVAKANFKPDDVLLELPMKTILTADASYADPESPCSILLDVLRENNVTDPYSLLAIRLLYETAHLQQSPWMNLIQGYTTEPSSVCLFDTQAIAELQIAEKSPVLVARDQHLQLAQGIRTVIEQTVASLVQATSALAAAQSASVEGSPDKAAQAIASSSFATKLFPGGVPTLEAYLKAYATVLNHAIEIPAIAESETQTVSDWVRTVLETAASPSDSSSSTDDSILGLPPLIQYINHANPEHSNAYLAVVFPSAPGKGPLALRLQALKPIAVGEEISISYGSFYHYHRILSRAKHTTSGETSSMGSAKPTIYKGEGALEVRLEPAPLSNTQLLLQHGISLPVNTAEAVALEAGIDVPPSTTPGEGETQEAIALRKSVIKKNHLNTTALLTMQHGPSSPEHAFFLQALRAKHLSERDLKRLNELGVEFHPRFGYFSLQNELRVYLGLASSLEELLLSYPTVLKDDKLQWLNAAKEYLKLKKQKSSFTNLLSARLAALAHRQALKRVLHSLVLDSLRSVRGLFASLHTRWRDDLNSDKTVADEFYSELQAAGDTKQSQEISEWKSQLSNWAEDMSKWEAEVKEWDDKMRHWLSLVHGGDLGQTIQIN